MVSRDLLLAVGFSLIILGLVLRGLARAHRRALAMRRQHELDARRPGDAPPPRSHLDRHLGLYANLTLGAGVAAAVAALFR